MIAMLDAVAEQMRSAEIAVDEAKLADYREKLVAVDNELRDVVDSSAHKELIFGDRFPFRYFVDEFGLEYYAAFPGCADKTEANSATVAFLIQKVREDKVPVILKMELSAGVVAEAIARETGAKVMEFHSAHNISREDFEAGVTYVDLMRRNLAVLREALR
jgi:zinc transport system substrate-binding protein